MVWQASVFKYLKNKETFVFDAYHAAVYLLTQHISL